MAKKTCKVANSSDVALKPLALKQWPHTMKCDLVSLEFPLFSWQPGGDDKVRVFEDRRTQARVEIHPSTKGSASIWDQEILIYLFTVLVKEADSGVSTSSKFTFKALDLLKATHRGSSGPAYSELIDSLDRLVGTRIKTNIKTGGQIELENFSMLESYRIVQSDRGVMKNITVTVSQWFFRSISCGDFLGLSNGFFDLRTAGEKRLYQIVRKHCGKQSAFKISLSRLFEKSGSGSTESLFKCRLRKFIGTDHRELLDYSLVLKGDLLYAFPTNKKGNIQLQKFHLERLKRLKLNLAA